MDVVEQDFELGFTLFKTPASFLMNTNLIPCAPFRWGVWAVWVDRAVSDPPGLAEGGVYSWLQDILD